MKAQKVKMEKKKGARTRHPHPSSSKALDDRSRKASNHRDQRVDDQRTTISSTATPFPTAKRGSRFISVTALSKVDGRCGGKYLFGGGHVEHEVCLDEGLGGLVQEGHVFVLEAGEVAGRARGVRMKFFRIGRGTARWTYHDLI